MSILARTLIHLSVFTIATATLFGADINACKYLIIGDFPNDPFGLAKELRTQGTTHGFQVLSVARDVPIGEGLKACVMAGNAAVIAGRGYVSMRVLDASGGVIQEASARTSAWTMSVNHAVRDVVNKIYSQLGYTGFDERTFEEVVDRRYPKRPTLAITEETIKKTEPRTSVEGIWTDENDRYRLGIVRAPGSSGADYLAVVLASHSVLWHAGEIKAEIRTTSSPDVFTCTYFMQDKKPIGTTLTMDHDSLLRGSPVTVANNNSQFTLTLMRVWPKREPQATSAAPEGKLSYSGTGFLLNTDGLLATNWHVVSEGKNVSVSLPNWTESVPANIVLKDKVNDLAILQLSDKAKLASTCRDLPYELGSAQSIALGQHVSTIGYPLSTMLGSNPKFSEGVVSSRSGIQDDPRWLQISAQVEPGSSGGPLFDMDGDIVGMLSPRSMPPSCSKMLEHCRRMLISL